jgi:MFS family permease
VCTAIAFAIVELRAAAPVVPLDLVRDRALAVSLAAAAIVSTVVMASLIVGPFYLSRGLGLRAVHVGVILSLGPAAAAVSASAAGRFVERLGAARTGAAGLSAMVLGASALALLPMSLGVGAYVAPLITMTAGYAAFQTANNTAVMARVDDSRRGVAAGLLALSRNLGLITGASAMGALFHFATGATTLEFADAAAVGAGMRLTLAVCAGLTSVVLAAVLATRSPSVHSTAHSIAHSTKEK